MSVDLSKLPSPSVVQTVSYETIFSEMHADMLSRDPNLSITPADPAYKILEVAAYREALIRSELNDRAKGLLLAYATGSDLDHLGVTYFNTERLVIQEADNNAVPPVPEVKESDDDYRARMLLAEDGYSTAGPVAAYIYHAKSATSEVKDVSVTSPSAGQVVVALLSRSGNGSADQALVDAVTAALSDDVRPMTDEVIVQGATIVEYTVNASLTVYPGFNQTSIRTLAEESLLAWVADQHRLGRDITVAGIKAALLVEGVHDVTLTDSLNGTDLTANLAVTETEAAYCTGVTVVVGGSGG